MIVVLSPINEHLAILSQLENRDSVEVDWDLIFASTNARCLLSIVNMRFSKIFAIKLDFSLQQQMH